MARTKIILGNELPFISQSFPTFEFHISKDVRKKYDFDDELFSISGNIVFADFRACACLCSKIKCQERC